MGDYIVERHETNPSKDIATTVAVVRDLCKCILVVKITRPVFAAFGECFSSRFTAVSMMMMEISAPLEIRRVDSDVQMRRVDAENNLDPLTAARREADGESLPVAHLLALRRPEQTTPE